MKRKSKQTVTPAVLVLGAVALGAIVLAQTTKPPVAKPSTSKAKKAEAPIVIASVDNERKPLSYYTGTVRSDLFTAPLAAEVKKVEPKKEVKPALPAPAPAPAPVDPFSDYAYTGSVNMGGQMVALIENSKTREGQYYKQGDSFLGGTITEITDRTVSINLAGSPKMLAKSDSYQLTPLDKSAPFLTQAPAAGAPGAPGAPGTPGAAPGMPGGQGGMQGFMNMSPEQRQQRMQQWMNNLTPEQRQQMQDRMMNRQFDRGNRGNGGGRSGFGGGGGGRRRGQFGGGDGG